MINDTAPAILITIPLSHYCERALGARPGRAAVSGRTARAFAEQAGNKA